MHKKYQQQTQQTMNNLLKHPKLTKLTKQEYKKFHRIRQLNTFTFGKHTLMSNHQQKYIQKVIPLSTLNQRSQFLTSHPEKYYSVPSTVNQKNKVVLYPLLGEPLNSLKIQQRWGKNIKNWIHRFGGLQGVLLDVVRVIIRNYEQYSIGDILPECYRVIDGKLVYVYDSWMNGSVNILKKMQDKAPFNLQQFYLSPKQLQILESNNQSHKNNNTNTTNISKWRQVPPCEFSKKLCLLILNFGIPEIKSRNYQFCQYQYNQQNIKQKIKFFKTRFSNKILTQLVDKLWNNSNSTINDLWQLFNSVKNNNNSNKFIEQNSLNNHKLSKSCLSSSFITKSWIDDQDSSILVGNTESFKKNQNNKSIKKSIPNNNNNSNNVLKQKKNTLTIQRHGVYSYANKSNPKTQTPKYKAMNPLRVKLRNNYGSLQIDQPELSMQHTKVINDKQVTSINHSLNMMNSVNHNNYSSNQNNGQIDLKKLLFQSITYHANSYALEQDNNMQVSNNNNGPKMSLLEFLGLCQTVPSNLYEQNIIKSLQDAYVLPDWKHQAYPNGALYFGQLCTQQSQSTRVIDHHEYSSTSHLIINTENCQQTSQIIKQRNISKIHTNDNKVKRNGKGLYLFDSYDFYIGDWIQNSMHGYGNYVFKSGQMYSGELRNGSKHGFGKFQYEDKRIFQGYWLNNTKIGMGTVSFPNNVKFFGTFKKNSTTEGVFSRINNKQVLKFNGILQSYIWQDDKFMNSNTISKQCNKKLKSCNLSSYLEEIDQRGNKYLGQCQNSMYHGFGVKETNNQIYQGNWNEGSQSGEGKLIVKGKYQIEGQWENGVLVQYGIP